MEKCAEQQRLLFLGVCSLEDRKRICNEKIMDLYNFERITYLLEAFGFEEYKFVFEMKYKDLLLKLADIVEQNLVCGNSMDKYVLQDKYEIRNEWQQEFIRKRYDIKIIKDYVRKLEPGSNFCALCHIQTEGSDNKDYLLFWETKNKMRFSYQIDVEFLAYLEKNLKIC